MVKLHSNNIGIIAVSDDDMKKIGRGYEVGHDFGIVTDIDTGEKYQVKQAGCGGDNCNCAVTLHEVKS